MTTRGSVAASCRPSARASPVVVLVLVTLAFDGSGFAYYCRELRSAKRLSAPPLPDPLPGSAVTMACTGELAGNGHDGGGINSRHSDRVVLTDDLAHLALRGGIRASVPRTSVTALRSTPLLGTVSVEVQHTGEGLVGPTGTMAFWGRPTEIETFLAQASAHGWPIVRARRA
jgi:hypothetical protein